MAINILNSRNFFMDPPRAPPPRDSPPVTPPLCYATEYAECVYTFYVEVDRRYITHTPYTRLPVDRAGVENP